MTFKISGFWKAVGAAGGIMTTLIIIQPRTLLYLRPTMLGLSVGGMLFGLLIYLGHRPAFRRRALGSRPLRWCLRVVDMFEATAWSVAFLVVANAVIFLFAWVWAQPTEQQVAQQLLNDRGMFLRRLYYKTALEVGNTTGAQLFHTAGFDQSLAFLLLGEQAETRPDQTGVQVLLDLDPSGLEQIVGVFATKDAPSGRLESLFNNWGKGVGPLEESSPFLVKTLHGP